MEMFKVMKKEQVLELLEREFKDFKTAHETVGILKSIGRITTRDILARENVPSFRRSTVDGYAVKAKNTAGCSDSLPAFLTVAGENEMGSETSLSMKDYEAVYVPTGGIVPEEADSMVMIEHTEAFGDEIAISKPASPLENIVGIGDDVAIDDTVLFENTVIKEQHIGVLAALGIDKVTVKRRIKVGIISTGNELVDINETPKAGQIRDVNSYALEALLSSMNCDVPVNERVQDDYDKIQTVIRDAKDKCDVILISGGSSVGKRDMTPEIIESLGKPGVLVHGIAIKPGKPTIVGKIEDTAIFGLPGHPASCIVAFKAIVEPFIKKVLLGVNTPERFVIAKSAFQVHVSSGRDVYQMVKLEEKEGEYLAHPVYGKSGMITLLSLSEGFVEIPMSREGIEAGDQVRVYLFN